MTPRSLARWALTVSTLWLVVSSAGTVQADRLVNDRFVHLGFEDGLDGRVLDLEQDSQGFLWIAMQNGLYRYDGGEVRSYRHDPDDPHSISDNYVRRLLVDSEGTLWIATHGGHLERWIPEEERFLRTGLSLGRDPKDIDEMAPGLFLVTVVGRDVSRVSIIDDTSEVVESLDGVDCVVVDPARQSVWGFGMGALTQHALDDLSEQRRFPLIPAFSKHADQFLGCIQRQDGTLWGAAYQAGAVRFDVESEQITVFRHAADDPGSLSGNDLTSVLEDSRGNLWIAGFDGLNRLSPGSSGFERFVSNPLARRGLVNHQVHDIFEDRTGQVWLGTDIGTARFDPVREGFSFYSHDLASGASAPAGIILSFAEDELGRLWVGSRNHGLVRMDRETGETLRYTAYPDGGGLPDNTVWTLSYEAPDRLWVGGESGLSRLQVETGAWRTFELDHGTAAERIVTLFRDRRGALWAGGDGGLYRQQTGSDSFERIPLDTGARIVALTDDAAGRLFAGLEDDGLRVLDSREGRLLSSWPEDEGPSDRSSIDVVTALATVPGEPETIWAGMLDGRLLRWQPDGTWSRFGQGRDLPFEAIEAMQVEEDGTLWLASGLETFRFEPSTGAFLGFRADDGWPTVVQGNATFRTRRGELLFGGLDGFVAFFPESIPVDTSSPRIVLTDFRIGDRSILPRARESDSPLSESITLAEEVTLDHRQNDFTIELASLHFGDPGRNRYAYLLEGVDTDWVEVTADRSFARYSGIPAGRHRFRARAANRDGIWSEEEAQLEIRVLPAPWRSWWAWTLYVLAATGLGLWWIRTKIDRLELERELQDKELKILRGMLPICSSCKKIRDDEGEWEPLETYLDTRTEAKFSHGYCPDCAAEILRGVPTSRTRSWSRSR